MPILQTPTPRSRGAHPDRSPQTQTPTETNGSPQKTKTSPHAIPNPERKQKDALGAKERRVRIRRVALHAVVHDLRGAHDRVAPERRAVDEEAAYGPARRGRERERDGPPVAVQARAVREVRPPRLAVACDAARAVCVDEEVAAGDDEPGGLALRGRVGAVRPGVGERGEDGLTWMQTTR